MEEKKQINMNGTYFVSLFPNTWNMRDNHFMIAYSKTLVEFFQFM